MKKLLVMAGMGLMFSASASAVAETLDGRGIFDKNCSVCHSINPPPKLAPPIIPLASRFHIQFKSKTDGVNHIAAYLKLPNKKNAIDQQAVARFGLMPAMKLPDKELRAVAGWVWDQYNPATSRGRGFGGQGRMNSN